MELKLKLKAEMQKGRYLVKNGRVIRVQNEKGLFKCFKHVNYAGNYYNYNNIKYLTISTNQYRIFPNKHRTSNKHRPLYLWVSTLK